MPIDSFSPAAPCTSSTYCRIQDCVWRSNCTPSRVLMVTTEAPYKGMQDSRACKQPDPYWCRALVMICSSDVCAISCRAAGRAWLAVRLGTARGNSHSSIWLLYHRLNSAGNLRKRRYCLLKDCVLATVLAPSGAVASPTSIPAQPVLSNALVDAEIC